MAQPTVDDAVDEHIVPLMAADADKLGTSATAPAPDGVTSTTVPDCHRPDLEGLRGVAIVLGFLSLLGALPGGTWVANSVFLVMSGFFATRSLLREADTELCESHALAIAMWFWEKRLLRLVPPLCVATLIWLIVFGLLAPAPVTATVALDAQALGLVWLNMRAVAQQVHPHNDSNMVFFFKFNTILVAIFSL